MKTISSISLFACIVFFVPYLKVTAAAVSSTKEKSTVSTNVQMMSAFSAFTVSFDANLSKLSEYVAEENDNFKKILGVYFKQVKDFISVKMMEGEHFKFSAPLEQIVKTKSCDIYGTGNKSTVKCSTPQ